MRLRQREQDRRRPALQPGSQPHRHELDPAQVRGPAWRGSPRSSKADRGARLARYVQGGPDLAGPSAPNGAVPGTGGLEHGAWFRSQERAAPWVSPLVVLHLGFSGISGRSDWAVFIIVPAPSTTRTMWVPHLH